MDSVKTNIILLWAAFDIIIILLIVNIFNPNFLSFNFDSYSSKNNEELYFITDPNDPTKGSYQTKETFERTLFALKESYIKLSEEYESETDRDKARLIYISLDDIRDYYNEYMKYNSYIYKGNIPKNIPLSLKPIKQRDRESFETKTEKTISNETSNINEMVNDIINMLPSLD